MLWMELMNVIMVNSSKSYIYTLFYVVMVYGVGQNMTQFWITHIRKFLYLF